jgi:hypothetical protein
MGDRGDEHVPDDCGEVVVSDRVVASLSPLSGLLHWFDIRPEPLSPGFSTWLPPMPFIPFDDPEETAARERKEAAEKVLAVLRGTARGNSGSGLAAPPCASCVLLPPLSLLPLGFPFPPALSTSGLRVNRSSSSAGTSNSPSGSTWPMPLNAVAWLPV